MQKVGEGKVAMLCDAVMGMVSKYLCRYVPQNIGTQIETRIFWHVFIGNLLSVAG